MCTRLLVLLSLLCQSHSQDAILEANIDKMNDVVVGFDVIIICTSTTYQARFWQDRLISTKGTVAPRDAIILGVDEDWNGKAGNGMGTLYAFQKAAAKAKAEHSIDLRESGLSIAIYHTAGKGTRLAPIHLAENSNKPGVKLPSLIKVNNEEVPLTILESVIKQTGVYAQSRKGRVSVFWGDQVFIPSVPADYKPNAHVDLLAQLRPMPSAEEWEAQGLNKYGLIAINVAGEGAQVEKVSHAEATELLASLGAVVSVGTSLGSFSLSQNMLRALSEVFAGELAAREGEMDTDPHFWMPLTLSEAGYSKMMVAKGEMDEVQAAAHWRRTRDVIDTIKKADPSDKMAVLGAVDVGADALWWDYGNLNVYSKNNLLLTHDSAEGRMLRKYMGVADDQRIISSSLDQAVKVDAASVALGVRIGSGSVTNSVLADVHAGAVDVMESIVIGVSAKSISCKKCILYGIVEQGDLQLEEGTVLAEVVREDGSRFRLRSDTTTDGKKAWKKKVHGNAFSFDEVHKANVKSNLLKIMGHIKDDQMRLRSEL